MIAFIDDHRYVHGVGPICRVLGIAPSTYYAFKAVERDPDRASVRAKQDRLDMVAIKQAFDGSRSRYGARKVWHQLRRNGKDIARCTVERLMKEMGLQGVVRGKKVITTNPDAAQPCPDDKVNRAFVADMPNQLWVSDFTYVSSWQGMVYVAFIIDVFARKIVGWRVSTSMTTGFVLDALNQAICQRAPSEADKLIHHSDRGSQGGVKRSSQRFQVGGCDDKPQTRLTAQHTKQIAFTRETKGSAAFSASHVLAIDQAGRFQRRGWCASWRVCPSWQSLVSRGRRHATIQVC